MLEALDVQPRGAGRELRAQAKQPPVHLEAEQAIDGLVAALAQEQVGVFENVVVFVISIRLENPSPSESSFSMNRIAC